jgi:3',5'-cyclic AMP phosphodiesterase CpdA
VSVRIAHLSDIHFGGELADAVEASIAAVAMFEPTLVAVTGDITLNGLPREFRAAKAWLARLPRPQLSTPGNHDTPYWNIPLRALNPFARYRRYIGPAGAASFDTPDLAVRAVNSSRGAQPRPDWSKGAIGLGQLRRLDWGEAGKVRVFACHHPLVDIQGAPVTGGVRRGAAATTILANQSVDLVLTGHVHVPFALPLTLATEGCYAVGAGTLSQRTRGSPPSFSTIIAEDDAFEVTVRAWTGSAFEATQMWRLPRRVAVAGAS